MPSIIMSLIMLLFVAAFFLLTKLRVDLDDHGVTRERRNSSKYICLTPGTGKKSLLEWLTRASVADVLARLPAGLEELDVSSTDIETLPPLPPGLKKLRAHNCPNLQVLSSLPDSLQVLNIWSCKKLHTLPGHLPAALRELWLVDTALRALPQLPATLEVLDAHASVQLVEVHQVWPQYRALPYGPKGKLHWINLSGTPAAKTVGGDLPVYVALKIQKNGYAGWHTNQLAHA